MTLAVDAVGADSADSVRRGASNRAERVEQLRRQMASVSEKMAEKGGGAAPAATFGGGAAPAATFGGGAAPAATFGGGAAPAASPGPELSAGPDSLLPLPDSLSELLPGALRRGTVAVLSGARSLELSMVAAVTAQGGHVAIIGQPYIGLLAAVEMGADLSRVAVIPEPGADPVEVAAVLLDGMDLVVLGLGGRSVSASRARAVVARARQRGCTLLVTDGNWQGASARLDAHVSGYEIVGAGRGAPTPGCGRISRVRLAMCALGRSVGPARALGG